MTDMDKMMIEPCPFCGGRGIHCFHVDGPKRTRYWILCRDCHACPGDKLSETEAIAAWNTRAYNPDDRLREALEAGQGAYREGYRNGFLDAQVTDESGPFCDDAAILRRIDSVAMAEGWDAYSDTFAAGHRPDTGRHDPIREK